MNLNSEEFYKQLVEEIENVTNVTDVTEEKFDEVNRPKHYTSGGIECIDAMRAAFGKEAVANFCLCNAFKYIWRNKLKGNSQLDCQKAIWYLNKYQELTKED